MKILRKNDLFLLLMMKIKLINDLRGIKTSPVLND